jgi:hypothetical protein
MREESPLFARFRQMIARLTDRGGDVPPFSGPGDAAGVRVPRHGGRPGRGAAIALEEPDEEPEVAPPARGVAPH